MNIYFLNTDEQLSKYLKNPDLPNFCPVCRHTIIPTCMLVSNKNYDEKTHISNHEVVFKCSNTTCNSLFICQYESFGTHSEYYATIPKMVVKGEVSEEIRGISPDFYKIYNQALQAEQLGLDSVCGVGFRKAIEFLVKDYLLSIETEKYTREQVERTALRNCIKQWIEDARIKMVLERATILGNDETHYKKIYIDKDISDLKLLIQLTLHFIDMELTYKQLQDSFPL